jgi:ALG11 mannosyltransferase N-terminus
MALTCHKYDLLYVPHSDSGGGGERVLWVFVYAILNDSTAGESKRKVAIYTGDVGRTKQQILDNVKVWRRSSSELLLPPP